MEAIQIAANLCWVRAEILPWGRHASEFGLFDEKMSDGVPNDYRGQGATGRQTLQWPNGSCARAESQTIRPLELGFQGAL
jgi:hypothetical protein